MQHLCLVSAQPVPNITPALEPVFKPEKVILAVSPEMKQQAANQEAVLKRFQIPVERLELPNAYDMPVLLDVFMQCLDGRKGQDVYLNATGGTKPMAIAAQEAFRMAGLPVFYVHDQENKVIWLDREKESVHITPRLKLDPFLQAHGYSILSSASFEGFQDEWRTLALEMASYDGDEAKALVCMNAIAAEAKNKANLTGRLKFEAKGAFDRLLNKMYSAGIIKYYDDKTVSFSSEAARAFANGIWLEFYLHSCLSKLKGLQDYAINIQTSTHKDTKNEIDGVVLHKNRLTIIECKTRAFDDGEQEARDALYKLDSLCSLGGLKTSGIIVSFFPLKDYILRRAESLRISVCHGSEIKNLQAHLERKILSASSR